MSQDRATDDQGRTPGVQPAANLDGGLSSFQPRERGSARPAENNNAADGLTLPDQYGAESLTLMFQDPCTLYCYWEVLPERMSACRHYLSDGGKCVLRVQPEEGDHFYVDAAGPVGKCYVNLWSGGGSYRVVFGVMARDGSFVPLLTSNKVVLPPTGASDAEDELWPGGAEFDAQVFRDLAGLPEGPGSLHLQSPGLRFHNWSSAALVKKPKR